MPNLLHLDSSIEPEHSRSRSRAITAAFASAWREHGDRFTITYRDLHQDPIPHLDNAALHWASHLRPASAAAPSASAEALQRGLIEQLLNADVLLVGAPMYNYSLPSTLKAWIDHIHVPGLTSPFDADTQPLAGRSAVVVTSRGGSYDAGSTTDGWDHTTPPLQLILGNAWGMTVSVIATNLPLAEQVPAMADQVGRARAELGQALEAAHELASRLARL